MGRPLVNSRIRPAEYVRQVYCATIEQGATIEDVMEPRFWAHIAAQLNPSDRIEIYTEDASWYAELMVILPTKVDAVVALLSKVDLQAAPSAVSMSTMDDYDVNWGGPINKYRVVRKSDKEVMRKDFGSKEVALAWLATEGVKLPKPKDIAPVVPVVEAPVAEPVKVAA